MWLDAQCVSWVTNKMNRWYKSMYSEKNTQRKLRTTWTVMITLVVGLWVTHDHLPSSTNVDMGESHSRFKAQQWHYHQIWTGPCLFSTLPLPAAPSLQSYSWHMPTPRQMGAARGPVHTEGALQPRHLGSARQLVKFKWPKRFSSKRLGQKWVAHLTPVTDP